VSLSNGCDGPWSLTASQPPLQNRKNLEVLILNHPQSFQKGQNKEIYGFDSDLIESFSASQNAKVKFRVYKNSQQLLRDFENGQGDIAIPVLPTEHLRKFSKGPLFDENHLSLFCNRKAKVNQIEDLKNYKLILFKKFSHVPSQKKILQLVSEEQRITLDSDQAKLAFQWIQEKKADCTLVEEKEGQYWAETYMSVLWFMNLPSELQTNWLISRNSPHLHYELRNWFFKISRNGDFLKIKDRYFLNWRKLESNDVRLFFQKKKQILPEYLPLIKKAALEAGLPWHLVAAVAYQESGWDPWAESHTGVKGFMQITLQTASRFGLTDRLDPEQSLWAGAQYLKFLLNQFPKNLNSKDRLALALAAYNIGLGHLMDAQDLALQMNKNPYSWKDLSQILPLLSNQKYYSRLRHRQARGSEAVDYVEKTKSYYHLLVLRN
jgi:membrane-bound lytic murein transglycosylase F